MYNEEIDNIINALTKLDNAKRELNTFLVYAKDITVKNSNLSNYAVYKTYIDNAARYFSRFDRQIKSSNDQIEHLLSDIRKLTKPRKGKVTSGKIELSLIKLSDMLVEITGMIKDIMWFFKLGYNTNTWRLDEPVINNDDIDNYIQSLYETLDTEQIDVVSELHDWLIFALEKISPSKISDLKNIKYPDCPQLLCALIAEIFNVKDKIDKLKVKLTENLYHG